MIYITDGSYEQFNQAFVELRKLGIKKFNPSSIHDCLIKIRCRNYADLIEDIVENKSTAKTANAGEKPSISLPCGDISYPSTSKQP